MTFPLLSFGKLTYSLIPINDYGLSGLSRTQGFELYYHQFVGFDVGNEFAELSPTIIGATYDVVEGNPIDGAVNAP